MTNYCHNRLICRANPLAKGKVAQQKPPIAGLLDPNIPDISSDSGESKGSVNAPLSDELSESRSFDKSTAACDNRVQNGSSV